MMQSYTPSAAKPAERADQIRSIIKQAFCGADIVIREHQHTCEGELALLPLGPVTLIRYQGTGYQAATRRASHVRRNDNDDYMLYLPLSSRVLIEQNGFESCYQPNSFGLVQTGGTFTGHLIGSRQEPFISLFVRMPGALLRDEFPNLNRFTNHSFTIQPGSTRVMQSMIESIYVEAPHLDKRRAQIFGESLVDVIAAAADECANSLKSDGLSREVDNRGLMRESVYQFIAEKLSDPGLNTAQIAENCGVSLRQLHTLFQDTDHTVAAYIREQRLLKCKKTLANPDMADHSVTEIALLWGFNDSAHFSRLYKARFGYPPSNERNVNH